MMMIWNTSSHRKNELPVWIGSLLLILLIALIDFLTGYQWSFSIFYLIPIIWITWISGRTGGILYSVLSAFAWLEADLLAEHFYTQPIIPYWNAFMRLGMFIFVAYILSELKKSLEKEQHTSRTDFLTQLANTKSFMESLNMEAERARRYGHPFSVAYIDVDNFKFVNDSRGHQAGDELLRNVAETVRSAIRQTDLVGRMGGDEFCVLLPETDQKKATEVMRRLGEELNKLVYLGNYQISFSIGCVTFQTVPDSLDEIIQKADDLMYQVKKEGKNQIYYSLFSD